MAIILDALGLESAVDECARPAIHIENGCFRKPESTWSEIEKFRSVIEYAISCVGRIETSDLSIPFIGTGFLVAEDIVFTSRHVAETFAVGIGDSEISLDPSKQVWINFKAEQSSEQSDCSAITEVLFIHPYWDVAALRVEKRKTFLPLHFSPPAFRSACAVVGFPARDMRNDSEIQDRIFAGMYNTKTLMPGRVCGYETVDSWGRDVRCITHDASTLGGTGGAPLIDVATGSVVGVNFAGRYLVANYAVPSWELMRDSKVRRCLEPFWMGLWGRPEADKEVADSSLVEPSVNSSVYDISYLKPEEVRELCDVLLLRIQDDLDFRPLFIGIPPELVASLPTATNLKMTLFLRLDALNRIGRLAANSHSPLHTLLEMACFTRTQYPEFERLSEMLQIVKERES